ncbi:hypothetical protein K491DRAFT_644351 [Lophiostoma macrostomum CBS 122681]|uniref:Uncharacterized protein n=1 Tax=Lophiostoma macrostomum CBS 122681 TaxID=1314788 RepID=A0A6A6SJK7_9PLEO|nr:hypothetical protein K491DRAFT_644351 [Lophiostoma macrostomum CBS 122681]
MNNMDSSTYPIPVRMSDSADRKRASPEKVDESTRLKRSRSATNAPISDPTFNSPCSHLNYDESDAGRLQSVASWLAPPTVMAPSGSLEFDHSETEVPAKEYFFSFTGDDFLTDSSTSANLQADSSVVSGDSEIPPEDDEEFISKICFGVIITHVTSTSTATQADQFAPVDLESFGDMVKMTLQSSGKYAGLIIQRPIRQLLELKSVHMSASLTTTSSSRSQAPQKSTTKAFHDSVARIVITGPQQKQLEVGTLLSDSGLCFQHPYAEECGDLEYNNPHFLRRPGSVMPKLQNAPHSGIAQTATSGSLNETMKSRVMRIFDLSNDATQGIYSQVFASPRLKTRLKRHQLTAVSMMVEREQGGIESCQFPSLWEVIERSEQSKRYRNTVTGIYSEIAIPLKGGLLADDMGLGKTLSALALLCLSLDSKISDGNAAYTTLIVTTKSTLPGWQFQINQHVHHDQLKTALYHGSSRHTLTESLFNHDVVLTTYETLRAELESKGPLYEGQWERVILDEAHHIRNRNSQIFAAACSVKAHYRWCLTGTPVHNSLDDYGALLSFTGVSGLTEKRMFDSWIAKPIQENKSEGFARLQALVRATCLRRTKASIGDALNLPPRHEVIEKVNLHPKDQELYDFFKIRAAKLAAGTRVSNPANASHEQGQDGSVLSSLNFLRLICNHGETLLPETGMKIWNTRDRTMTNGDDCIANGDGATTPNYSAKLIALLRNLISTHTLSPDAGSQCIPVKSVVFTYWTKMLDLIQSALSTYSFKACRIDGNTSLEGRKIVLEAFNNDPGCSVMLATIGSAGEGLDLTVANHVHLIEPHWNPMVEAQAVDRVYRIGQKREVTITRYIVPRSIETYIQWVQQQKLKMIINFSGDEEVSQADIDMERMEHLRENLGCEM